jgi:hypothetical protein
MRRLRIRKSLMAYHSDYSLGSLSNLLEPERLSKPIFYFWPILNSSCTNSVAKLHEPIVSKVKRQIDPSKPAVLAPLVEKT